MRIARLHAAGDVRLADGPQPNPGHGEELVHVDSVGICGSDLHWFTEGSIGDAVLARPLVLGHEMAGTVVCGPRTGLRVAIDPANPCWICPPCRDGHPNLCLNVMFAGHGATDGGMREYLAWPSARLHPVPDAFDADTTAMLEPLGVAIHAVDLAHVKLGSVVLIVGCGPIGQLAIQLAHAAGASAVLAIEPLPHRRELASRYGAVSADPVDAADLVGSYGDSLGADLVIEIAGTDSAVDVALKGARPGARVVLAGIPGGDRTTFVASTARRKGLTLVMSRRMKEVYPRAIRLVESGQIAVDGIISDRFDLHQIELAMKTAAARTGHKVVLHP